MLKLIFLRDMLSQRKSLTFFFDQSKVYESVDFFLEGKWSVLQKRWL